MGAVDSFQLFEEVGGDREQVAAGKFEDFLFVAERGAHDLGLVAEFFVVIVDFGDRFDAGIFGGRVGGDAFVFLVPVEDAADERGDEGGFGFGAGDGLGKAEHQGHVAVDPLFFELLGGEQPLPRWRRA